MAKTATNFWKNIHTPMAIAHRGGDAAGQEKENSLAAFRAAYKAGCRWFETDIVATRDGKLVVIHGKGFQFRPNRDLPARLRIQSMTFREIEKKIRIGGEKVPLLETVLAAFDDTKFFIDPKTNKAAPLLAEILSKKPAYLSRVCVGSFSRRRTIEVSRKVKEHTGENLCTSLLGPAGSFPLLIAAAYFRPVLPLVKKYIRRSGASSLHIQYYWLSKKVVEAAHQMDLKVIAWTPNTPRSIQKALDKKVDGIMSDQIKLLRKALNKQN